MAYMDGFGVPGRRYWVPLTRQVNALGEFWAEGSSTRLGLELAIFGDQKTLSEEKVGFSPPSIALREETITNLRLPTLSSLLGRRHL